MFRQRHEARFDRPVVTVFASLLRVLAPRRWADEAWFDAQQSRLPIGRCYLCRNGAVVRHGRIVECRQPVLLTLYETLLDAPCKVDLRLRWRLEPHADVTAVLLDVRYALNGPAYMNRRRWREQIAGQSSRSLAAISAALAAPGDQGAGVNGQSIGSSAMTVTNTMAVNGKPTFR